MKNDLCTLILVFGGSFAVLTFVFLIIPFADKLFEKYWDWIDKLFKK